MKIKPVIVQRNIRLPKTVARWAEEMAVRKGHGADISAYIADLIRCDKAKEDQRKLAVMDEKNSLSLLGMRVAYDQIARVIEAAAQRVRRPKKKS
jgi:hypothetical protein